MEQKENKSGKPKRTEEARRNGDELSQYVFGKVQPQALALEEVVLGALMLDREALPNVMDILRPESFYLDAHQIIYRAVIKLFERSHPVDLLTVTEELRSQGNLDKIGGAYTLVELTNRVASSANIEYHARIIAQKAMQRALISVSTRTIEDAYKDTTDVFNLLDEAEKGLFNITQNNLNRSYQQMGPLSSMVLKNLEELAKKEDGLTGVPSGFLPLDRITSGWQPSDFIIVAARPAMGKCLGKGTKVVMFDGSLRNVEDVRVGDLLMGDDSTPRRVLSLARGREKMYWVHQAKGMSYRVNESHILSLKYANTPDTNGKSDACNISIRAYLDQPIALQSNLKGYKVGVQFQERVVKTHPYLMGLSLSQRHELERDSGMVQTHTRSIHTSYAAATLDAPKCLVHVQIPAYTCIPRAYLINTRTHRLQLLAGMLDGSPDARVYKDKFEIAMSERQIATDMKYLCDTLGFRTVLTTTDVQQEMNQLDVYCQTDEIPIRVKQRQANNVSDGSDWQLTDIRVEYDQVDEYFGFEIDGNKLFLLEDMTVTHNTSFVLACALNAAMRFQKPVALFSLEMASVQLVQRLISMESEIEGSKMRSGKLSDYEWQRLQDAVDRLSNVPIFIDDTPGINIFELRAKCRRLKMRENISIVIIDYLQLMSGNTEANKNSNREQEISNISRALKGMAKELNIPVIALSQLSRAVETRGGSKRPQLSDLRESGAIEQDADIVSFIYRPEYYQQMEDDEGRSTKGVAEIIIAKHRNGAVDTARLKFTAQFARFEDLPDENFSGLIGPFTQDIQIVQSRMNTNDDGGDIPF